MILLASKSYLAYSKSDFKNLTTILRQTDDDYVKPPTNPITYNPEREIITLTAFSESKVNQAMADLRLLFENFSTHWEKYLVTSQPSTARKLVLDSSSTRRSINSGTVGVFPLKPKEDRRLVQIWFKSILPALRDFLHPRLGGRYSVCLVRRGQSDLTAKPYIQIESPCVPGQKGQTVIKDWVNKIWEKAGHEPISMRFIEGSVKRLSGVDGAVEDDDGKSKYSQLLDLHYNLPYSKPGMGASVGLLCSDKCSATLGGYILIGGEKYMLTAEHLVANSRELADPDDDCDTLTSPSREDLKKIENNLDQVERDIVSEINSLVPRLHGDRDVPENEYDSPPPELRDAMSKKDDVKCLLDQVTMLPNKYAVGTVKKLSLEVKNASISRSLARDLGLGNENLMVNHQMDWALIKTNGRTGDNRHKYRSNQDAIDHGLYVDKDHHANQPGDIVYETCGAESGYTVYYVGQRSKHRSGKVTLPTFDGSSGTLAWGILGLDDREIPEEEVAGDSGAWVIRKEGNKLMGQVHSYSQGQVLFTPIDVIFADLETMCKSEVSLPPCPPGLAQIPSPIPARPLCSVWRPSPARAYQFLKPSSVASITSPETSSIEFSLPEARPLQSSSGTTTPSSTDTSHSQRSFSPLGDSPASLRSLCPLPHSLATKPEYPRLPQSLGNADLTNRQVYVKKLPSKPFPTIIRESAMSETTDISLDEQGEDQPIELKPYTIQFKFRSSPGTTTSTRTSTWPVIIRWSQATKARRGFGSSQFRTSRKYTVPYSAGAVVDRFARFARRVGTCPPVKTSIRVPKTNGALQRTLLTSRHCRALLNTKLVPCRCSKMSVSGATPQS